MGVGICNYNFLDEDTVSNVYESSEKAAYPSSNVYDINRRTKVWRTDGFFKVVEGENKIIFREQAGVDLEAEVVAGEYATLTLFLTAVKNALEAAGVGTYTVDTVTSGKIRITQSVAGGATVFQLMTTDADFADMAEMLGFGTDANFTGATTYTADVLRIHSEEWLEWDLGFPSNPEAFILIGDRNKPLKLSSSAVVKLQANWTRDWANPQVDQTITFDEFVLAYWDFDGIAGNTYGYRYWRVQIVDKENPRLFNEFGGVYLGSVYQTTRGCAVFPLEYGPQDLSVINYAEAGQTFGQKLPLTKGIQLNWNAINKSEEQQLRQFFEKIGRTESFFIIADSDAQNDGTGAFSQNMREWIKLVKFQTDPRFRLTDPNFYQAVFNLREEL